MAPITNTHQYEAWNGYEGQHWADNQERYDAMVGSGNRVLFHAADIQPTDRVLDIGCGTGLTTRRAATLAPHGHAHGIDLSGPMLARARAPAAEKGIGNVSYEQGDAQVHPFPPESFDRVISRGGVWYFEDSVAAFTNIAAALRPGGRLAIATPSQEGPVDNGFPDIFRIMGEFLPEPPALAVDDDATGADTLSTPDGVTRVLSAAGFAQIRPVLEHNEMYLGRDSQEATDFLFGMGPMRHWFRDVDPAVEDAARAAVSLALADITDARGVRQPASGLLTTAVRLPTKTEA